MSEEVKTEEKKEEVKPLTKFEMAQARQDLEMELVSLYNHPTDRFYAHLFYQIDREVSAKCPTMGVGMQNGRIKLQFNPRFLQHLKTIQQDAPQVILKHECLHLINEHLERGRGAKEKNALKHQMENIAMDVAINQVLDKKVIDAIGGVTMETFRALLTHKPETFVMEPNQTFEYYFDLLQQEADARGENGEDDGDGEGQGQGGAGNQDGQGQGKSLQQQLEELGMDEHGSFGEMDALDRAMLEDKIQKAVDSARADGAGKLPSEVEDLLRIKKKPQVNWKRKLKQFVGAGIRANNKASRSHRNRRYGITFAGKKKDHIARILVVLDTSGSMYGDRTEKVLSELYGIYKANDGLKLDIVECDAQIQDVFTYDGKENFKYKGGGGTQMQPALDYGEKHKYDGIIMLSDGEYWETLRKVRPKVLWLIANNDSYKAPFGDTVHVK
jgi:predicted metal-dependent peptidase